MTPFLCMRISLFRISSAVSQYRQVSEDHSTPWILVTTGKESEMIQKMTLAVGLVITMVLQQANGQCEYNYYSTVFLCLLGIN